MLKISAVIITFNEASRIRATLDSLVWCDEIIIVDSGSTDETITICKEYSTCKVFNQPFLGYGPQKKHAVDLATHDWVLSIDADEVVVPELKLEIKQLLATNNITHVGFHIPRSHVFLNKVFMHGREYKHYYLRLFNKKHGNFNNKTVHEGIEVVGTTAKLKNHMLHDSYINTYHYFEKFNSYTTLAAENSLLKKKKISKWSICLKFPFSFFKYYIIDRNFMNGYAGFVWALFSSFYKVVRVVKYYELTNK
jgi:glycosyltransferase involved in cell wall biosynthesis